MFSDAKSDGQELKKELEKLGFNFADTNGICGWYQNQEKERMIRYYALFCEVTKQHGKAITNHPCQSISVCPLRVKHSTAL